MRRPEAHEPSPVLVGDVVVLTDGRRQEVVLVTPRRVLVCSEHLTRPEVKAVAWEGIDRVA